MRVCAVLGGVAGLLRATRRVDYMQCLGSCSEEELRRRVELRFESGDMLGAWEIVQNEEVYLRIKDGKTGGYLAMAGMVLTGGVWHERHARIFERSSRVDAARDEKMIKRLLNEMATGDVWKAVNKGLVEVVARRLQEECSDARRASNVDVGPSSAADHIALEIERRQPSADRRWGRVLEELLRNSGVRAGIAHGRYNAEVRRILSGDEELANMLYSCIVDWGNVLNGMVDKNRVFAREVIADAIEEGYWLYMGALREAMGRRLFYEGDAFGKIRAAYGLEGKLSIARLKELVQEGRLDELVKRVIGRLVRHGRMYNLMGLVRSMGERVFQTLAGSGELDTALRKRMEELIRDREINNLVWLVSAVKERFDGILRRGELDEALKEGMESLVRHVDLGGLKVLLEIAEGRVFGGILRSGELDEALEKAMEELVRRGWAYELKMLVEIVGERFEVLLGGGELDGVLKERVARAFRHGWVDELKTEAGARGESLEGLVSSGELDRALAEVRHKWTNELKMLIETMSGRFGVLLVSGGLDGALKEGMEKLVMLGWASDLKWLVEMVEGRVFDELVRSGELDRALEEAAKMLGRRGETDELETLMQVKGRCALETAEF